MINNRQAGRRRGRGGGNNNGQRQGNPGRPDGGNRIDSRARGNASQLLEKYRNLAADAQRQGDRVNTEYFLQFADHYFRVLSEQRGRVEDQQPRRQRDDFDFDGANDFGGDEFGDEGEPMRGREPWGEQGGDAQAGGQQGGGQPRAEREERGDRQDRPREARRDGGEQRPPREPREWQDRGERRPRDDRQRDDRPREDRFREERPVEIAGQRRAEPLAANESLESRAEEVLEADRPLDAPQPRRRGRPRRDEAGEGAPAALDADRLPPSLTPSLTSSPAAANDEAPGEPKPRRRRVRAAEDTPTAAE